MKFLRLTCAAALLLLCCACVSDVNTQGAVSDMPEKTPSPPHPTEAPWPGDLENVTFRYDTSYTVENKGYAFLLPDEYRGRVTLEGGRDNEYTLLSVYQTSSMEEMGGFVYSIERYTPAQFERHWITGWLTGGFVPFAKDENYYFVAKSPTDVQCQTENTDEYMALRRVETEIRQRFMADYGLVPYDVDAALVEPAAWYPGRHARFRFELSGGGKMELLLSQPAIQGDGGIWCVERMFDQNENFYFDYPHSVYAYDDEWTAMDFYEYAQAEAAAGRRPELLDPETVALEYLEKAWDWARDIQSSEIEYFDDADDISVKLPKDAKTGLGAITLYGDENILVFYCDLSVDATLFPDRSGIWALEMGEWSFMNYDTRGGTIPFLGLFIYNFNENKITFSADCQKAVDAIAIQGSWGPGPIVQVSADGKIVQMHASHNPNKTYWINTTDGSYTVGPYEPLEDYDQREYPFGCVDYDDGTIGAIAVELEDGQYETLNDLVFVRAETMAGLFDKASPDYQRRIKEWRLFENWTY
jgi:hypothetical protein